MSVWILALSLGLVLLTLPLAVWRLREGPYQIDRVAIFDLLASVAIGLLLILGLLYGAHWFFDIAVIVAILAFVGTIAFAVYLDNGEIK
jgi:multicomponent Na+:H+ antiporter subunit F